MQDDTAVEIWLSKDSVGSKITLTSLTDWAGLMSFPSKDNYRKSNNFEDIPRKTFPLRESNFPFDFTSKIPIAWPNSRVVCLSS